MNRCPFALFYTGDAYSTDARIMGRQMAGKSLLKAMAQHWSTARIHALGGSLSGAQSLYDQLAADGFSGAIEWSVPPDWQSALEIGCLYFPSPVPRALGRARDQISPSAFSLIGITHTIASSGAMDHITALATRPFQPWDALICTSEAARQTIRHAQAEAHAYWAEIGSPLPESGIQLPVIPLGVDVEALTHDEGGRAAARAALGLQADEVAFLFSGRLSFNAKAHPVPLYQALETAAQTRPIVLIEAGLSFNKAIEQQYQQARAAIAPSVRFIQIDGNDVAAYARARKAADVFTSLSDHLQETFGLTPVEAMAAGLPVLVSDWNGYKDTVRDGIDGMRVPTIQMPVEAADDLDLRYMLGLDNYDYFIGRASLATVVHPQALSEAVTRLASDPVLRQTMGMAGQARARELYDWPVILQQYEQLAATLQEIRQAQGQAAAQPSPTAPGIFRHFAHFSTATLPGNLLVAANTDAAEKLEALLNLNMVTYGLQEHACSEAAIREIMVVASRGEALDVNQLLQQAGHTNPGGVRALMWLWKFGLIDVKASPQSVL